MYYLRCAISISGLFSVFLDCCVCVFVCVWTRGSGGDRKSRGIFILELCPEMASDTWTR